jgi:DNA repair photolyase
MRKNITDKLKTSLESERKNVKSKFTNTIEDRFSKADIVFNTPSTTSHEKINVVRDTFTLPEKDYGLIRHCQAKLLENKISVTKSEIIRAGLIILSKLADNELVTTLKLVEKIKTGRPKNN